MTEATYCQIHAWTGSGECQQCAAMPCESCGQAPSTENWGGTHDQASLARNPRLIKRWCRRCVLTAQVAYMRPVVPKLAEAERELAELERAGTTCKECGCTTGGGDYCHSHKPYTVTPLKDGTFRTTRHGLTRVWPLAPPTPESEMPPPNQVICAAIRLSDGTIIRGHRHDGCFKYAEQMGIRTPERFKGHVQGFIDARNRFVDRKEALRIQLAAGIPSASGRYHESVGLFSEDLY